MVSVDREPHDPPIEAPDGADPLLWRLAYGLHRDHRPHTDNFCVTCREFWPCEPSRLAQRGFAAAIRPPGERRAGTPYDDGDRG